MLPKRRNVKFISGILTVLYAVCLLMSGCGAAPAQIPEPADSPPANTAAPDPVPEAAASVSSLTADELILYFNELALGAEYPGSDETPVIRKWTRPFGYYVLGDFSEDDMAAITGITELLNTIPGFPGISPSQREDTADMVIRLCSDEEFFDLMGDRIDNEDADGAGMVLFNSSDNEIQKALVCIRRTTDEGIRPGVIAEEIINCIGLGNDSTLRPGSLLYEYGDAGGPDETDIRIISLLYDPAIRCGMDAAECEEIIRELFSADF